ncbi:MAG TPA: hypothetical protein VHZ31_01005 [Solirubrobacteraceae bacterium]|jgi:hypothetical protein|nr:hypothetical protein [Solirubrobacteraceae bacterium]
MNDVQDGRRRGTHVRETVTADHAEVAVDEPLRATPLGSRMLAVLHTAAGPTARSRAESTSTAAMDELQCALDQILSRGTVRDSARSRRSGT